MAISDQMPLVDRSSESGTGVNLALAAYLLHLVVPAFLFVDVLSAWLRGETQFAWIDGNTAVAVLAGLWLSSGLWVFVSSRNRPALVARLATPLLTIYAIYLMVFLAEIAVGTAGITSPIPTLYQPGTKNYTYGDPAVTPGVSGPKTFTINRLGLRGPLPPDDSRAYKIVAIGASSTICANLDDSEDWPHVLMEKLNASQHARPVWVGNAGVSGFNTVHHIVLLQWLPGVLHSDMAIFLVGGNDLQAALAFEGGSSEAALEKEANYEGPLPPGVQYRSRYPLYRRLKLVELSRVAVLRLRQRFSRKVFAPLRDFNEDRKLRAESPVVPLPDLSTGLREYRQRLLTLSGECRSLGMRCLFLTQPTMWRDDLSPDELRLLWGGYTGRREHLRGFVPAGDLARAMAAYNTTLLAVCRESGMECYDIAAQIPKNISAFMDDDHFNESGSRMMAEHLAQYLLAKAPFN